MCWMVLMMKLWKKRLVKMVSFWLMRSSDAEMDTKMDMLDGEDVVADDDDTPSVSLCKQFCQKIFVS